MKIARFLSALRPTISRYPAILLISLITSLVLYAQVSNMDFSREVVKSFFKENSLRMIFAGISGISFLFGMTILGQRLGKKALCIGIGIVLLILYLLWLPPNTILDSFNRYAYWVMGVVLASHLFVSVAPYVGKSNKTHIWSYNQSLFVSITTSIVFTVVLIAGLMLAVTAVNSLFDLNFDGDLYVFILCVSGVFGSSLIFLLFVDNGLSSLEAHQEYPSVLRFLVQYILIPLLLIYALIFYAYIIKIVVTWELPKGYLSYLVLAYSVLGILSYLLVYPLRDSSEHRWVRYFSDIYYYSLIPLVLMLFVAIYTRVSQYGITENRYIIIVLAFWLLSVIGVMIWTKGKNIFYIPTSLLIVLIASLALPYINMFSTSIRSQKKGLSSTLKDYDLLKDGVMSLPQRLDEKVIKTIDSKFRYLHNHREYDFLSSITGIPKSKIKDGNRAIERLLDASRGRPIGEKVSLLQAEGGVKTRYDIAGYDILIDDFSSYGTADVDITPEIKLSWKSQEHKLILTNKGITTEYDLSKYADSLFEKYMDHVEYTGVKDLVWDITIDGVEVRIDLVHLSRSPDLQYNGKILVRIAK